MIMLRHDTATAAIAVGYCESQTHKVLYAVHYTVSQNFKLPPVDWGLGLEWGTALPTPLSVFGVVLSTGALALWSAYAPSRWLIPL